MTIDEIYLRLKIRLRVILFGCADLERFLNALKVVYESGECFRVRILDDRCLEKLRAWAAQEWPSLRFDFVAASDAQKAGEDFGKVIGC